jgi:hypothetical protein
MSVTSKSPRDVLVTAYLVAQRSIKPYSHKYSRKDFTQHQLFAILVLKNFLKTDYRGVVKQLKDCDSLCEAIQLTKVPHYTTLQKASVRLLKTAPVRTLLDETVRRHMGRRQRVPTAAIDSTGMECSSASGYFVNRRKKVGAPWKKIIFHRYPKLGVVCDVQSHFIFAYDARSGPRPDVDELKSLVDQALDRIRITTLLADAGYDSESNHSFARDDHGIRSVIPARQGRPTKKPASGRYRRLMQVRFNRKAYRQRSQVETVMSMIKRRQGNHVHGRSYHSQCRDLRLMVLTHNVMILLCIKVFYRAAASPFRLPPQSLLRYLGRHVTYTNLERHARGVALLGE